MRIKAIGSEREHDEALREIERLWGARQGTHKGDRLDMLIALVESYEHTHYPMGAAKP